MLQWLEALDTVAAVTESTRSKLRRRLLPGATQRHAPTLRFQDPTLPYANNIPNLSTGVLPHPSLKAKAAVKKLVSNLRRAEMKAQACWRILNS